MPVSSGGFPRWPDLAQVGDHDMSFDVRLVLIWFESSGKLILDSEGREVLWVCEEDILESVEL